MFPRTVSTTRRVHARVRALKNLCLHTFRIRNTCKCVTFNTTPCLSHNYPPMYLKRNTTTQLLNLRTLLCMQLLTYEAVFEYIVWPIRRTVRRVHCKKRTQLYTTLWLTGSCPCANIHIQGRVCVQCVVTYFHMFYDKRRVSTRISRLCHVHAQAHTLKDMSSHTFCLMEMCPSTVWLLVSHYFV